MMKMMMMERMMSLEDWDSGMAITYRHKFEIKKNSIIQTET